MANDSDGQPANSDTEHDGSTQTTTPTLPPLVNTTTADDDYQPVATNMKDDDPNRHIFPFFDLPRELRDLTYDEMLLPTAGTKFVCGLKLEGHNVPSAGLPTVSRQFASKYEDRGRKKARLVVDDTEHLMAYAACGFSPTVTKSARFVHVNISTWDVVISDHHAWLSSLTELPQLESLSIKLVWDNPVEEELDLDDFMDIELQELCDFKHLTSFEVFATKNEVLHFDFSKHDDMILKWSTENRSFQKFKPDGIAPELARLPGQ